MDEALRLSTNTTSPPPRLTLFCTINPQWMSSATPLLFGRSAHLTGPYISYANLAPRQSMKSATFLGMGAYVITPRVLPTSSAYPTLLIITSTSSVVTYKGARISLSSASRTVKRIFPAGRPVTYNGYTPMPSKLLRLEISSSIR